MCIAIALSSVINKLRQKLSYKAIKRFNVVYIFFQEFNN